MRFFIPFCILTSILLLLPQKADCGSPYAANGLGILVPDDQGRAQTMGSAGAAYGDGMNLMRGNPALLGTVTTHTYAISMLYDKTKMFYGGTEQPEYARTNPSLVKFVFPLGRGLVVSWGLSPYSRADAKININAEPGVKYNDKLTTSGGINISTVGFAGSIKKRLYLGIAFNYHFGAIDENWTRIFDEDMDLHNTTDYLKRKYKGYSATFGVLVNPYKQTYVGFGYTTQAALDLNVVVHPGSVLESEIPVERTKVNLPSMIRMGVSSQLASRLITVLDYSYELWEDAAKTTKEKAMYNNSHHFGGGIRLLPSTRFNASYYKTVPVSLGFKIGTQYYKSYPKIDVVSEKAVTMGFEFPLKGKIGILISSFEYGTRGDKDKNGWDETYFSFGLSLIGKIR
ncbi:MAG: hypothetical protein JXB48_10665 [Candidatus Latescibacteria bacterium]|nr:hypothetical protein [Candidatus Latescibacterota bacterium]